ncbi:AraC family transcriptional regulator [Agromyces intestinalis]|uniref:AraC family transcriptional regulator n=1 Tax=Agromyces intestinalis TaxID=2592652 RepID=A0A5C1YAJ8_9MICO|nr:AraC family transcriptional regulator [Agromyces intestinalis]QEO13094.1 AraC family transcriptional regulator [Agromyces intestinalis]
MEATPWDSRDRIARVLQTLRMRGVFYCRSELTQPWGLEMPAIPDSVSFHVPTFGSCWLRVDGVDPVELRPGDLALVPHGRGHEILSSPGIGSSRVDLLPQHYLGPHYSVLRHGGGGRATQLICGIVAFDDPAARELVRGLPKILTVSGDEPVMASSVRDTLRLMADELTRAQPGAEAVATRLSDILVVQAIRAWLAHDPTSHDGWLLALHDDRIGGALEAMHAEPHRAWNLEQLARVATMSRSAFSARFTGMVGEAPMAYLTRWRMSLAVNRLRDDRATVAQVAAEVGYESEAAFTRAFARTIGQTPGAVRRQAAPASASASGSNAL